MRRTPQQNTNRQKLFVVLMLTGILSAGAGLSLLKTATAESFNRDNATEQVKQRYWAGKLPQTVADAVLKAASQQLGSPTDVLRIVKFEQIQTNGCLNLPRPGEGCTKINMSAWEVTVQAKQQRLIYRSDRTGSQVRFNEVARNIAGSKLPKSIENAVLQKASEEWGLPKNSFRIVRSKKVNWAHGCEIPSFPHPCDPVVESGWQATLESGQRRWIYNTDETGSLVQLYKRELINLNTKAPSTVVNAALNLASAHLSLPTSQLLITEIQEQTWPNGCLGLQSPVERCMGTPTPGWRITVEGKPNHFQVYRTDNSGNQIRTEAIAGMPSRNDQAPNSIAYAVLRDARQRLNAPTSELHILQAQMENWSNSCFDLPTPGNNCAQALVAGWRVTVHGKGQSLVYRTNDSGSEIRLDNTAS